MCQTYLLLHLRQQRDNINTIIITGKDQGRDFVAYENIIIRWMYTSLRLL